MTVWLLACWRVARLRGFTETNYAAKVTESVENTIGEQIGKKLHPLFNQQGINPPTPTQQDRIIEAMVQDSPNKIEALAERYRDLAENGSQSLAFGQACEIFMNLFGGG